MAASLAEEKAFQMAACRKKQKAGILTLEEVAVVERGRDALAVGC
jgi:hypothetical protein